MRQPGYIWSPILSVFSLCLYEELIMTNGVKKEFSGASRRRYKQYATGTYIGLIAHAIQDSPAKMLTFKQIMKQLEPYVFGDKKGIENNIRVCLSSNRCFAKVPVDPAYPNPKKNFWKVDESSITPKLFRRHFRCIMNTFHDLPIQTRQLDGCEDNIYPPASLGPVCKVTENKSEVKFTGPFSIESILKSDQDVKRMRGARLEENPHFGDSRFGATKRKHFYEAMDNYYPVSAVGFQFPQLPSGLQFGLSPPQHITYDHRVLLSSPSMYDRFVRW